MVLPRTARGRSGVTVSVPMRRTLHEWFRRQAEETPDAVAITFDGQHFTYAALLARSNQVANHLRKFGVRPDEPVGIFLDRSFEMVVALLGILQAGGAYVPLDPFFPQTRLDYMVENSGMRVLITHREFDQRLQIRPRVVVRLDSDWNEIEKSSLGSSLPPQVSSENLAYILYTSGSTGKPKGVEIPHSAVVNLLMSMQHEPGFHAGNKLLAVTTLSFDIAVLELFLPLVSGGTVVIANREEAYDPMQLMQRIRESQCDLMQATPTTWRALIDAGWPGSENLKVLCGGEALTPDLARELLPRCAELWNMYGPTETTVWSIIQKVTSADGPIPIGWPIANTEAFVLDANRNVVPQGLVGELYIGGAGLARGYLNLADLTEDRFIHNPFARNALLYRTGDLARTLPDGAVQCMGRVDSQVKIRGFRIELGEVEAVLSGHSGVRQCVVTAFENSPDDKILVAYIESQPGPPPTINDLRAYLKTKLPEYMVPSVFVSMPRLPLSPNGKIDRKALPPPSEQRMEVEESFVPPNDALEQTLAQIWSKILKVKRVGLRDDFFELGGHSFAAVVLLTEVRKLTGKNLPLSVLFEASTIAAMANILRKDGWAPSWSSLVGMQTFGTRPPLFLVHGAEGNVLLYRQLTSHMGNDQPVYGLQSLGLSGDGQFQTTVQEMAAQYIKEIVTVQPKGPYFVGGYCLGGIIAFEIARQLNSLGEKTGLVIMLDTYNNYVLSRRKMLMQTPTHLLQNVWFHIANTLSIPSQDRTKFLKEKLDITFTRLGIRFQTAYHFLRRSSRHAAETGYPHLSVKKANDRAAIQYVPQLYNGRVAVIRPKTNFAGLRSPTLGWNGFVHGDLDVRELAVYPKGMLVEPFCRALAEMLNRCLEEAR
jgi:amino acid adenylation domain-containing protein